MRKTTNEAEERSLELQLITSLRNDVTALQVRAGALSRENEKLWIALEKVVDNQGGIVQALAELTGALSE